MTRPYDTAIQHGLIAARKSHPAWFHKGSHVDPRHVEAYLRLEFGTLDALSREEFNTAVRIAVQSIAEAPAGEPEALALSFGIAPIEPEEGPECGHSACSQNFIDTGEESCLEKEPPEDLPDTDLPGDDAHRAQESMRFKR